MEKIAVEEVGIKNLKRVVTCVTTYLITVDKNLIELNKA